MSSNTRIPIKYNYNLKKDDPKFQINGGNIVMEDEVYEFEPSNKTTIVDKDNVSLNTAISELNEYVKNLDLENKN